MPSKIKRDKKGKPSAFARPGQEIKLLSPQTNNYAAFIVGNAQHCDRVVEPDSHKGQHVVICGAGPSLAEHAAEWCPTADVVIGCNSAATWLLANGHRCDYAFAIDQNPEMVAEWVSAPDVEYLLASTVHPHLVEYLLSKGRTLRFFHNFVGVARPPVSYAMCHGCGVTCEAGSLACPACQGTEMETQLVSYEDWLYMTLYPGTIRAGSGLNAVTRAIDVARFMGFDRITVLGADCALKLKSAPLTDYIAGSPEHLDWLRNETVMHADGGSALASNATPVTLGGVIDAGTEDETVRPGHGRHWETKPDLIISAVWLAQMARKIPGLTLVGDTLPNALSGKSEAFLKMLPSMVDSSGDAIGFTDKEEA
jgi:hypothetical protein